eukprot:GHVR01134310.1.p1 GENE.GHVR01134310.1~~GHVR01134310.1.p1  ORF type:complete len:312 (-),score=27.03 GHVR01134310.1:1778-2713(-)
MASPPPGLSAYCSRQNVDTTQYELERLFPPTSASSIQDSEVDWDKLWQQTLLIKPRHYQLPKGQSGKLFINKLTDEMNLLASGRAPSQRILAFCAAVLARCQNTTTHKQIQLLIVDRLRRWDNRQFTALIEDAVQATNTLHSSPLNKHPATRPTKTHTSQQFIRQMRFGNTTAAIRCLSGKQGRLLPPTHDTIEELKKKHPQRTPPVKDTLLQPKTLPPLTPLHITPANVEKAAERLQGGAGPSGINTKVWKDALLKHGSASSHLRKATALLIERLANTVVPSTDIKALMSSKLIRNLGLAPSALEKPSAD